MSLRPATSKLGACVVCHATVAVGERGSHVQEHRDPRGACVRLLWCATCADRCDWLQRLADSMNAPDDCPEACEAFESLHRELHARLLAEGGPPLLRACLYVARDLPPPLTLRGPNAAWGLPTRRSAR